MCNFNKLFTPSVITIVKMILTLEYQNIYIIRQHFAKGKAASLNECYEMAVITVLASNSERLKTELEK